MLTILRHDLHKFKVKGFIIHKEALSDPLMKKADGIASWFSRNGNKSDFDLNNRLYIRESLLYKLEKNKVKNQIRQNMDETIKIFLETDPEKLHTLILKSKTLNKFSEAVQFPSTSFKFHLLLTCGIYYNLYNNNEWQKLYLLENGQVESPFQVIYKDKNREWALSPAGGMSRVFPEFFKTWVRRTEPSIGGENVILDGLLSQIGSWSTALATIEDWHEMVNK